MMTRRSERQSLAGLPEGVFPKHGRYYRVIAQGTARKWHALSRVSEGLPALYAALAALLKADTSTDSMGALIEGWKRDVMMVRHSAKTQQTDQTRLRVIGEVFRDIRAKALTDKEKRDGMGAARDMGAHATDSQTSDYVRRKSARKTGATK